VRERGHRGIARDRVLGEHRQRACDRCRLGGLHDAHHVSGILVIDAPWALARDTVLQLVQLGDEQRRRPRDLGLHRSLVLRAQGGDRHRAVIDQRCLQSERAACHPLAVAVHACVPATCAGGDALRHYQVDGDELLDVADLCSSEPDARLCGEVEVRGAHRRFERRRVGELGGVEGEVAVGRVWRHRDVRVSCAQVDGLRAGEDDADAVGLQRGEGIEQHPPRLHVESVDRWRRFPVGGVLAHPVS